MNDDILFPRIECNDGFSVSVQARSFCYCSPRNNQGPYTAVECGFPTAKDPVLEEYAENPSAGTTRDGIETGQVQTVYGWVPVETVLAMFEGHGGIANDEGREVMNAIMNGGPFLDRFRQ